MRRWRRAAHAQLPAAPNCVASAQFELAAALREAEDRFSKVLLSSDDAILVATATAAEFRDVNSRACAILGYTRQELLSMSPRRILFPKKDEWELLVRSLRNKSQTLLRGTECQPKSGLAIPCDIFASTIKLGGRPCILATIHDARQRELAASVRRNAAFARFSNAVAIGTAAAPSIEHAIRFCIHQICDFAHWLVAHAHIFAERIVKANTPTDFWHFGLHERSQFIASMHPSKRLAFPQSWYSRIRVTAKSFVVDLLKPAVLQGQGRGLHDWGVTSALVAPILAGDEVIGACTFLSTKPMNADAVFLDLMNSVGAGLGRIIEHKRLEESVRNLSKRLFHVEDDERRRLARELHDTTAQNIAAIIMDLGVIGRDAEALAPEACEALSESLSLARQCLDEVRTFSYVLHPPMLDELGLVSALRIYIQGFARRSGMHVDTELPGSYSRLPIDLEIAIFRVVQEGLTNARRHSGSSTAQVKMLLNAREVRLTIQNENTASFLATNGTMEPTKTGVGIKSMQERLDQFGGQFRLRSDKNRTILEAIVPVGRAAGHH
jgi:PAS domain S-box-containing protein